MILVMELNLEVFVARIVSSRDRCSWKLRHCGKFLPHHIKSVK